ncbi:MAG TPA: sensor histidine kinase [Trebonia sp.]|nr:sensor histidine kinase [Trebonia sp.]
MTASVEQRSGRTPDAWRRYGVDVAVALAVTAAQVGFSYLAARHHGHAVSALGYVLLAVSGLALIWRRRFVAAVLVVSLVTTLWSATTADPGGPIWGAVVVAFGTAIYYRKRAVAILSLVAGYVGSVWLPALTGPHKAPSATFDLSLAVGLLVLLGGAEGIRFRHERAEAQRHIKEEEARRVASEERVRIARDLHDVVAHNISVINVQAATALHLADRQPERDIEALATIHGVSRQALVELRSILGVLRAVDDELPRDPAPSLSHLDDLVSTARSAGLQVRVSGDELSSRLPKAVDVAAYRIVQEALTNAARHAAGSTAAVRIASDDSHLLVEVEDNGGGKVQSLAASGSGNGIAGMTERAEALGGTLAAGTRPEGGFSVRARLPLGIRDRT